eukprot:TRINITY_DN6786_c0_g1_i17.p1 TRINITY_DN6786_c0_g1~~TRINITY_DN6786_c0_g1_i17.p1  ORF type:complete len:424 (-),score=19.25 TRINITY_DN6786_c0_g1_i17:109-1380(-)
MDYEYRPLLFEDNLSPELTSKEKLIASLYLGVCFCLLFLSYTTTLFLLTTFFGLYGFYAILIICGLFILVSPASSFVVYWMGIEKAMSASAFGYGIFIACCLVAKQVNHPFIILIGAIPIGLGAAILWVAQGMYMGQIGLSDMGNIGKYNGVFFAVFGVHLVVGTLISGLIVTFTNLHSHDDGDNTTLPGNTTPIPTNHHGLTENTQLILLIVLLAFSVLSSVMFLFVKKIHASHQKPKPFLEGLKEVIKAVTHEKFGFWVPYLLSDGINQAFFFMTFPLLLSDPTFVNWVVLTYGLCFLICSQVSGKLLDRTYWYLVLVLDLILAISGYVCVYFGVQTQVSPLTEARLAVFARPRFTTTQMAASLTQINLLTQSTIHLHQQDLFFSRSTSLFFLFLQPALVPWSLFKSLQGRQLQSKYFQKI